MTARDFLVLEQLIKDETRKVRLCVSLAVGTVMFCAGMLAFILSMHVPWWIAPVAGAVYMIGGFFMLLHVDKAYKEVFGNPRHMMSKETK